MLIPSIGKKIMITPQNIYNLQENDSFLENKKNELLLALYEKKYQAASQIFNNILLHIKSIEQSNENSADKNSADKNSADGNSANENSEKLLNQIHVIIKKFSKKIPEHILLKIKENNKSLKAHITDSLKQQSKKISHINLQPWEERLGLNQIQKNLLYKTAMTFQLTIGCSNYCRRCNEWALPKVRSHFSFDAIKKILLFMAEQKNDDISLYGASDPLDWKEIKNDWEEIKNGWKGKEKNISDIIEYLNKISFKYNILTKVPIGKEYLLKELLKSNANLSVSITSKNKNRISKIEKTCKTTISKQHDLDELLIPAGLDEDFISIKPSITDGYGTEITPDGAFIIIPTFTSALHPFGHKKIPINLKTQFFPIKKTGRDALLVDYFKPLNGYNLKNQILCLDYLLDVQVESIILDNGKENLTPPGMRSVKEYLSIFEDKPRLQRKKMTKSVIKRLKKQFLENSNFKDLSHQTKKIYLKKIKCHLDLCKKDDCLKTKLFTISFFLESISKYICVNRVKTGIKTGTKTGIMKFLLKDEIRQNADAISDRALTISAEELLNSNDIDSFDIFRFYIFNLLDRSDHNTTDKFIKKYPSQYDTVADIFVYRY